LETKDLFTKKEKEYPAFLFFWRLKIFRGSRLVVFEFLFSQKMIFYLNDSTVYIIYRDDLRVNLFSH
jgi:hypothetical protein